MNNVNLIGRLTKEPNLARTAQGTPVTRFILAVDGYKDHTDFIPCVCWNKTAENVQKYCTKGSLVGVEGSLRSGSYEKNGNRIYTLDVVANRVKFLDTRKKEETVNKDNFYDTKSVEFYNVSTALLDDNLNSFEVHDDDLPF